MVKYSSQKNLGAIMGMDMAAKGLKINNSIQEQFKNSIIGSSIAMTEQVIAMQEQLKNFNINSKIAMATQVNGIQEQFKNSIIGSSIAMTGQVIAMQEQLKNFNINSKIAMATQVNGIQEQFKNSIIGSSIAMTGQVIAMQEQLKNLNINSKIAMAAQGLRINNNIQDQFKILNQLNLKNLRSIISTQSDISGKVIQNLFDKSVLNLDSSNLDINELDISMLDEVISPSNNGSFSSDSSELNTNDDVNLEVINNIIDSKLEIITNKEKEFTTKFNELIYLVEDIRKEKNESININSTVKKVVYDVLINIIVYILIGVITHIGSNIYNEYNKYMKNNGKQIIKTVKTELKKIKFTDLELNNNVKSFRNIRCITKHKLEVKSSHRNKSCIICRGDIGNIVRVINKNKKWVNIEFVDREVSDIKQGWVLSKYVKKLKL
ncbi:hypothetical protein N493_20300 (plasmid) [Clostridium botulinum B2 433]|uniref:hypothetical protein n=1 Tax=Clostridium botulinum TaxID=1491 RepID=UPI0007E07E57|nr:hypothetical protein [Clostridium botulinum]KEI83571.1 hypothetical protein N493_20300 [Clostridium botulinum B2 433]